MNNLGLVNLYKTFVAGGISLTITALGFMGSGIIENERRNVDDHKAIRYETSIKIDKVKDIVSDIKVKQSADSAILKSINSKL